MSDIIIFKMVNIHIYIYIYIYNNFIKITTSKVTLKSKKIYIKISFLDLHFSFLLYPSEIIVISWFGAQ